MPSSRESGNYYYHYADIYDTPEDKEEKRADKEYRDELEADGRRDAE